MHATFSTNQGLFPRLNIKLKQYLHRPITRPEGSRRLWWQISRQWAHKSGKVVSPTHWLPLPHEIFLVLISVRDWVGPRTIVRPEGLCQWKIQITPLRTEPATFRIVAQSLKQLRHHVLPFQDWRPLGNTSIYVLTKSVQQHDLKKYICFFKRCVDGTFGPVEPESVYLH